MENRTIFVQPKAEIVRQTYTILFKYPNGTVVQSKNKTRKRGLIEFADRLMNQGGIEMSITPDKIIPFKF